MKVFIMRHGTTVWNEQGFTQGRSNNRLSKSGVELTKRVAENFAKEKIDVIYVSPLMRTMQTANLINKHHNVKIIKDERLTEVDQGIFTGRFFKTLTDEEKKLKSSRSAKAGMESMQSVGKRVKEFSSWLIKECPYKNVLVITHNVCASMLATILQSIEIDYTNSNHVHCFDNAEIKKIEI